MPVVIPEREAADDTWSILRAFPPVKGVCHCFSGSVETARELVKMGYMISFTGTLTFKNARKACEVAADVPSDRIMIETDCPYMAPEPYRGRRCDSRYLEHTCRKLAELRGITAEQAADLTTRNAMRFYGLE